MKIQTSPSDILSSVCRALCCALVWVVTMGAGGCPVSTGTSGTETPIAGIAFADATGTYGDQLIHAVGDVVTIPVSVTPTAGEQAGQRVTVTIDGFGTDVISFSPTSKEVNLPAVGQSTFLTFQATINRSVDYYVGFRVRRPATPTAVNSNEMAAQSGCYVVAGVIEATFVPTTAQIPRGATQSLTVKLQPRGTVSGTKTIDLSTDTPSVTVTPSRFDVTFPAGSSAPIERTVLVKPAGNAGLGQSNILVREFNGVSYGRSMGLWRFQVIDGAGSPEFTFTASQTSFVVPNGNPADIAFTLRSVNGFDGDVAVSHSSVFETLVEPNINPYIVRVSPGAPVTYVRKLYRFFGTTPVTIIFRANSAGFTRKEITATLTLP